MGFFDAKSRNAANDNVEYPPEENLMHYNNPATIAQDIDIIQVKVMHDSKLIRP